MVLVHTFNIVPIVLYIYPCQACQDLDWFLMLNLSLFKLCKARFWLIWFIDTVDPWVGPYFMLFLTLWFWFLPFIFQFLLFHIGSCFLVLHPLLMYVCSSSCTQQFYYFLELLWSIYVIANVTTEWRIHPPADVLHLYSNLSGDISGNLFQGRQMEYIKTSDVP